MTFCTTPRAAPRVRGGALRRTARRGSSCPPSVALEHRLLLVGEGLVRAFKVLGVHAPRLRPGLHLERLPDGHAPLGGGRLLGDAVGDGRAARELDRQRICLRLNVLDEAVVEAPGEALVA